MADSSEWEALEDPPAEPDDAEFGGLDAVLEEEERGRDEHHEQQQVGSCCRVRRASAVGNPRVPRQHTFCSRTPCLHAQDEASTSGNCSAREVLLGRPLTRDMVLRAVRGQARHASDLDKLMAKATHLHLNGMQLGKIGAGPMLIGLPSLQTLCAADPKGAGRAQRAGACRARTPSKSFRSRRCAGTFTTTCCRTLTACPCSSTSPGEQTHAKHGGGGGGDRRRAGRTKPGWCCGPCAAGARSIYLQNNLITSLAPLRTLARLQKVYAEVGLLAGSSAGGRLA